MFVKMAQLIGLASASVCCAFAASSPEKYPARPIRIIVPFTASANVLPRALATKLSEQMGQSVIVENRPGASGQIGLQLVRNAVPDGYTLAVAQAGTMVVNRTGGRAPDARIAPQ